MKFNKNLDRYFIMIPFRNKEAAQSQANKIFHKFLLKNIIIKGGFEK